MHLKVKIPKGIKLAFVGDIHEHEEQFNSFIESVDFSSTIIVSVGDIYDKGFGKDAAERITKKLSKIVEKGQGYAIKGNHELMNLRSSSREGNISPELAWWEEQPLSITFIFSNMTKITAVHGGVLPSHSWYDIANDVDVCYVRYIDENGKKIRRHKKVIDGRTIMTMAKKGQLWHDSYDGRFGYIVSGHHSQKDGIAKFYKYSCNLDTAVYHTGKLTVQLFEEGIRKELLTFEGKARYPDLVEMEKLMTKGKL